MRLREATEGIARVLTDRSQEGFTGGLLIRVEYAQGGIRCIQAASEPQYDEVRIENYAGIWNEGTKSP